MIYKGLRAQYTCLQLIITAYFSTTTQRPIDGPNSLYVITLVVFDNFRSGTIFLIILGFILKRDLLSVQWTDAKMPILRKATSTNIYLPTKKDADLNARHAQ